MFIMSADCLPYCSGLPVWMYLCSLHSPVSSIIIFRYQSTVMGSFQTLELIETFINYQESIKRCICIIYDPQRTKTGSLKV